MGEGFYISVDESNGNESPKKRARTGSLSDHGPPSSTPRTLSSYRRLIVEMDTDNIVQSPQEPPPPDPTSNSDVDMQNGDSSSSSSDIVIPSTPPGKEDQLKILKAAMLERWEIGSTVYLFPTKWFEGFTNWAQGRGGQPSRVDPFAVLCDQDGVILESAQESRDYHIIPQEGWSLIQQWSPLPQTHSNLGADSGLVTAQTQKSLVKSFQTLQAPIEAYPKFVPPNFSSPKSPHPKNSRYKSFPLASLNFHPPNPSKYQNPIPSHISYNSYVHISISHRRETFERIKSLFPDVKSLAPKSRLNKSLKRLGRRRYWSCLTGIQLVRWGI
jgi:hypothetical protein